MGTAYDATSASAPPFASANEFEQTFQTGERCRLVLENPRGSVHVNGWDRHEVTVRATKRWASSSRERFEGTRVEAERRGDIVVVRTVFDRARFAPNRDTSHERVADLVRALSDLVRGRNFTPAEVVYEVRVPRRANLEIRGVSSDLVVDEVWGSLDITTGSGALTGRALQGSLHVKSVSGDVKIAGKIDALKVSTVSSDVELTGTLAPTGCYQAHTVSGDLTLRVSPDTAASISASGASVKGYCALPYEVSRDCRRPGARQWQGLVNGGGAEIHFQSVSGALRMSPWLNGEASTATAMEQIASPVPAEAPLHTEKTRSSAPDLNLNEFHEESKVMVILRTVERGEMTVDDALRQIDALRPVQR